VIIFKLSVTASSAHPTYLSGIEMAAICMVDSRDADLARQRAAVRLHELGWSSMTFKETVLLPLNPDTSAYSQVMVEALSDARELGVSLIVYPEPSGAA
jgi:hypothetical protein